MTKWTERENGRARKFDGTKKENEQPRTPAEVCVRNRFWMARGKKEGSNYEPRELTVPTRRWSVMRNAGYRQLQESGRALAG